MSSTSSTAQTTSAAALLVTEGVEFGADKELLQRYTEVLEESGALGAATGVISDAKGITLIGGFLTTPMTDHDACIPGAIALLLANLGPELFISHLPRMAALFRAVTDSIITERAYEFKENPSAMSDLLTDVLSYQPLNEIIAGVSIEKLKALVTVLIAEEDRHSGLSAAERKERQSMIGLMLPNLTVTDDPRTRPANSITVGFSFRKQYVNTVFPYPTFGKTSRFYYPDYIIDRLAAVHAHFDHSPDDHSGTDFNVFLIDEPGPAEIEEAFAYLHLFRGLTGRVWKVVFAALRHMNGVPQSEDYSTLTGRERMQCEALMIVLAEAFKKENSAIPGMENLLAGEENASGRRNVVWRFSDQRLIDFLLDHPERAGEVAAIARDRNTLDWGIVSVTLETTPAISGGAL